MDCNSLPGLKRTALPGGMLTSAPVRGLRPMPVLRGRTLNTPKPRSSMRSPRDRACFMLSKTTSTACSAFVLVMPVFETTWLMMSSLITGRLRDADLNGLSGFVQLADTKGDTGGSQRPRFPPVFLAGGFPKPGTSEILGSPHKSEPSPESERE